MPLPIWRVHPGDILDEPADVLICSANPYLTLSGGVGGALLLRYGPAMQRQLEAYLRQRNLRHVSPGTVVACSPCGTPYRAVLHAVAVDAFYDSSPEVVTRTVSAALTLAASYDARKVGLTALATGYGHLSIEEFGAGVRPLIERELPPIEEVVIVIREPDEVEVLREVLGLDAGIKD